MHKCNSKYHVLPGDGRSSGKSVSNTSGFFCVMMLPKDAPFVWSPSDGLDSLSPSRRLGGAHPLMPHCHFPHHRKRQRSGWLGCCRKPHCRKSHCHSHSHCRYCHRYCLRRICNVGLGKDTQDSICGKKNQPTFSAFASIKSSWSQDQFIRQGGGMCMQAKHIFCLSTI